MPLLSLRMALSVALVLVLGAVIQRLPITPLLGSLEWIQTPIGVLFVVCGIGKLLYDTLFYDHYK